jgi:hypothetical protein
MDDESLEGDGPEAMDAPAPADDVDPQFAADVSEAFPDLDDNQISALQRAVLGLLGR